MKLFKCPACGCLALDIVECGYIGGGEPMEWWAIFKCRRRDCGCAWEERGPLTPVDDPNFEGVARFVAIVVKGPKLSFEYIDADCPGLAIDLLTDMLLDDYNYVHVDIIGVITPDEDINEIVEEFRRLSARSTSTQACTSKSASSQASQVARSQGATGVAPKPANSENHPPDSTRDSRACFDRESSTVCSRVRAGDQRPSSSQ